MRAIAILLVTLLSSLFTKADAQSELKFYSVEELSKFSSIELRILRNEIFARHGYIFRSQDLNEYYITKDWYNESEQFSNAMLSDEEKDYLEKIKTVEKAKSSDFIFQIDTEYLKHFTPIKSNKIKALNGPAYGRDNRESAYSRIKSKAEYWEIKRFRITEDIDAIISYVVFPDMILDGPLTIFFLTSIDNQGNEIETIRLGKYERISDEHYEETGFIKGDKVEVNRYYATVGFSEVVVDNYQINYKGQMIKK